MDKRIEQRIAWINGCMAENRAKINKLWTLAIKQEKQSGDERWEIAKRMGLEDLENRSKWFEDRLAILKEISGCDDMRDAILMLSLKAKMACDSLYDFDGDSKEYEKSLRTISECTHMISMLA